MYFGSKNGFFAWRFSNIRILLCRPVTPVITLLMTLTFMWIWAEDSVRWKLWWSTPWTPLCGQGDSPLCSLCCMDSWLISCSVLSIFKFLLTVLKTQRAVLSPSLMLCDTPYDFLYVTTYIFFIYLFIAHGQPLWNFLSHFQVVLAAEEYFSFCFHGNLFILPEFHCLFCVTCAHVNVICLWCGLWDRDHLWVYPLVLMEQSQTLRCVAWDEFLQILMLCFHDKKPLHVSGSLFLWSTYHCISL